MFLQDKMDVSKAYDTVWTDGLFYQLNKMGISGRLWRLMYRAYQDFKCHVRIEDKTSDWFTMQCGIHQGGFLSLTKYVAFINGLLLSLKDSGLCCTIGAIPSTPVGYADDIATANTSKRKTDKTLQLVHNFGTTWRFKFNAKKSAVLVYGESRKEHEVGIKHRHFKLGKERVGERCEYDHVGIKACIFSDNNDRISEKITKGRRTLNAASGLGIRKSGITLRTCNLIFWSIVIPTVTFGCELWQVNDNDLQKLQNFQKYSGRRVQRFPKRSPSCTSYYGLGWLRIETYVQVKKLLFILTFLFMNDGSLLKRIFKARVTDYVQKNRTLKHNPHNSPICDMLDTSIRFNLLEDILKMTFGYAPTIPKKAWSKMVWDRARKLDDICWKSTAIIAEKTELLIATVGAPHYLTWWHIADNVPQCQAMCEIMARLICHASQLRDDDPRYKGSSPLQKMCQECDLGVIESVQHLVMQCPANEGYRIEMFNEIIAIDANFDERCNQSPGETYLWLLGKQIERLENDKMCDIWIIAGHYIAKMYKCRLSSREGIG